MRKILVVFLNMVLMRKSTCALDAFGGYSKCAHSFIMMISSLYRSKTASRDRIAHAAMLVGNSIASPNSFY